MNIKDAYIHNGEAILKDLKFENNKLWKLPAGKKTDDSYMDWAEVTGLDFSSFGAGGHNHDDLYLKLTGGTMTGVIERQYNAASNEPVLKIGSANKDIQIFKVYSNDIANYTDTVSGYGYSLQYIGSGSGVTNYLRFVADNSTGTKKTALSLNQSGQVGILADPNTSYALYVNGNTSINGDITATTIKKSGGTSSQFLKADGSVDSNTYALNSSLGNYLPLSGGTMTGAITMPSGSSATDSSKGINFANGSTIFAHVGESTLLGLYSNGKIVLRPNGATSSAAGNGSIEITNSGITVYETLTAESVVKSGGTSSQFLKADGSVDSSSYALSSHNHDTTYVTLTTEQKITGYKLFKGSTPEVEGDTVRMPIKISLNTYADAGHNVAAIGFANEENTTKWYKGFFGYERTGSYDRGKFVFGLNNTAAAGSATYDDIVVTIDAAGNVTATTFTGNLSGNATSATTAATAESVDWTNITNKPATATGYGYIGTTAVQASSATQDVTGIGTITLTKIHTTNYEVAEGTNNRLCVGSYNQSTAKGLNVGDLLVSNAWADSTNVPTNGIYAKGNIKSAAAILAGTYIRATGNDVYIGSATNSQCHLQFDNTNKCLKFIFD